MIKNWILVLAVVWALAGCGKSGAGSSQEATLEELNQVLAVLSMGSSRPPTSVNELTNFPSLRGKSLPKPPAGKKLVIDPASRTVVFVPAQ